MAQYYCDRCKLWDDDSTPIYHCYECGICRVGHGLGKDFFRKTSPMMTIYDETLTDEKIANDAMFFLSCLGFLYDKVT